MVAVKRMSQFSVITLDPRSDLFGLPVGQSPKPSAGELTTAQTRASSAGGLPGFSAGGLAGFTAAAPGTYQTYRQISAHPTNALVRGIVSAPIVANTWRWKKLRQDVPDQWLVFARQVL